MMIPLMAGMLLLLHVMLHFKAPSPPYLGPPDKHSGQGNKPIKRVVIHCTVSPTERGGARRIAAYFRSDAAGGSAHYVVDPYEIVQAVYDSWVAWHAPPNPNSLGIELCCTLSNKGRKHWGRDDHRLMLRRAARLTAALCLAYDVPIRKIGPVGLRAGRKGICGHHHVSQAFGQSSHWDPGPYFPWKEFIRMCRHEAEELRSGKAEPEQPKKPAPQQPAEPTEPRPEPDHLSRHERAMGAGPTLVDRGRAWIEIAAYRAKQEGNDTRRRRLLEWLDKGPKK
jgi:N-acetyl-anhydromuramyl-L-alanine amidase AmpD